MSPIGVGIIGLSKSSGWTGVAHSGLLTSPKYRIVGLLNSSKASGEQAVKDYDLPAGTKSYGSLEELVADPEIGLVVVGVRVDRHYAPAKAAVEAGKDVFVEWPLGNNAAEARELADLAKAKGVKTMVGLQGRVSPVAAKVKELIAKGAIGSVLSSSIISSGAVFGKQDVEAVEVMNWPEVGADISAIMFGHMIDYVLFTLGEFESYSGTRGVQRKESRIIDGEGKLLRTVPRHGFDTVQLQGRLDGGALLVSQIRGGATFKGEPPVVWRIYGEDGEILVTSPYEFIHVGNPGVEIKLHKFDDDSVETVSWADLAQYQDRPAPAQHTSILYDAFADGRTDVYADWEHAAKRHEMIESFTEARNNA